MRAAEAELTWKSCRGLRPLYLPPFDTLKRRDTDPANDWVSWRLGTVNPGSAFHPTAVPDSHHRELC